MQKYNKFIVAIVGVILTELARRYGANDWYQGIVMVAAALGVYHVPNTVDTESFSEPMFIGPTLDQAGSDPVANPPTGSSMGTPIPVTDGTDDPSV